MNRRRVDVVIVGGGPAGLYAAQLLAGRGVGTLVLEEHDVIGDPVHCTGVLGAEALALPGVPREVVLSRPHVARFHSPEGHQLLYPGPEDEVLVIDRGAFDRRLGLSAREAGAMIMTSARAIGLQVHRGGVRVEVLVDGRPAEVCARVCVLACGPRYAFQRSLGWGVPEFLMGSVQTEVALSGDGVLDVFLRDDLVPNGFAWLVPFDRMGESRAKVGVMAPRHARQVLRRVLDGLAKAGRAPVRKGPIVARLLPLGPLASTYGDRVLAVGDAAGLVKPTTGGGIYYSLLSARWAAETIVSALAAGDLSARMLAGYQRAWQRHLGLELRVGVWFRRLVRYLTPGDLDSLTRLAIEDGLMPVVRATARFNWHHQLILRALTHPGVLQVLLRRLCDVGSVGRSA